MKALVISPTHAIVSRKVHALRVHIAGSPDFQRLSSFMQTC